MKKLFDKTGRYTKLGNEIDKELRKELKNVFQKIHKIMEEENVAVSEYAFLECMVDSEVSLILKKYWIDKISEIEFNDN